MADLTLRKVPAKLLERLKASAAANRRSLNGEILARLQKPARTPVIDVLAELRALAAFIRGRPTGRKGRVERKGPVKTAGRKRQR